MKVRTLFVAAVMFLALSAAAFAQATFQVGSIPVTTVANTGYTEKTGDITFSQVAGSSLLGTISVVYPVPITVPKANISIIHATGACGVAGVPVTGLDINSVAKSGTVVINVPAGAADCGFTLTGVRVQIADTSFNNVGLTATISSVGNAILAGQTSVTVISQISAPLKAGDGGDAVVLSSVDGSEVSGEAIMSAAENYLDAFGLAAGNAAGQDSTATTGRQIKFVLTPPPVGVTLHPQAVVNTSGTGWSGTWVRTDADGAAVDSTITSKSTTSLTVYYTLETSSNPSASEYLAVPVTVGLSDPTFPLNSAAVTYTASMAPIGTAFDADGNVISSGDAYVIPRFKDVPIAAQTLLTVTGSKTTLLIPYAGVVVSSEFDTGLAIANTTTDPNTDSKVDITGAESPVAQAGTITFYFYQQQVGATAPTVFSYTTKAGDPGSGVDANGDVPSGSTYVVLLSQLLGAAGVTGDFQGYIFVVANFTNAHAQYVLTDFKSFANGGQGLIIAGTNRAKEVPETLGN